MQQSARLGVRQRLELVRVEAATLERGPLAGAHRGDQSDARPADPPRDVGKHRGAGAVQPVHDHRTANQARGATASTSAWRSRRPPPRSASSMRPRKRAGRADQSHRGHFGAEHRPQELADPAKLTLPQLRTGARSTRTPRRLASAQLVDQRLFPLRRLPSQQGAPSSAAAMNVPEARDRDHADDAGDALGATNSSRWTLLSACRRTRRQSASCTLHFLGQRYVPPARRSVPIGHPRRRSGQRDALTTFAQRLVRGEEGHRIGR